jgi:hypothetical protein
MIGKGLLKLLRLLKKCNENTKNSCLLAILDFVTIYKTYYMLITKATKVDTKLMKLVLNCAKVEVNEAVGNTKEKIDTKLMKLVLNCAKSKPNQAIGKANERLDTNLK